MINEVWLGDCLERMTDIPDNSIDMVLCDPPYGSTACKWDQIIPLDKLWPLLKRVAKKNAAFVFTASQPFTSVLVMSNVREFKYEWIWDKEVGRGHLVAKKRPMSRHENVCVFYSNPPTYNPLMTLRDKPTKGKEAKRTEIMGGKSSGFERVYTHKYPQTILSVASEGNKTKVHPTQKPVQLFEYLIKTYTNEGELVLDFAAGSGTTAIAAMNCNRNYLLIEKEPEYFDIINKRIEKHKGSLVG